MAGAIVFIAGIVIGGGATATDFELAGVTTGTIDISQEHAGNALMVLIDLAKKDKCDDIFAQLSIKFVPTGGAQEDITPNKQCDTNQVLSDEDFRRKSDPQLHDVATFDIKRQATAAGGTATESVPGKYTVTSGEGSKIWVYDWLAEVGEAVGGIFAAMGIMVVAIILLVVGLILLCVGCCCLGKGQD